MTKSHYCIFVCWIPPWRWPKNVETCSMISTCLQITVTNYSSVVGVHIVIYTNIPILDDGGALLRRNVGIHNVRFQTNGILSSNVAWNHEMLRFYLMWACGYLAMLSAARSVTGWPVASVGNGLEFMWQQRAVSRCLEGPKKITTYCLSFASQYSVRVFNSE